MDSIIKINEENQPKQQSYGSIQEKNSTELNVKSTQFQYAEKQSEINLNEENKDKTSLCGCLNLDYYKPYFNVDQNDVSKRLLFSFKSWKPEFISFASRNPDLYGPFWIYSTLVFLVVAAGNMSRYLKNEEDFKPNFSVVPTATLLIFTLGFLFPLMLSMIMKFLGSNVSYIQVLCVYGYSLTCFIPITLLCIIPSEALQWALLIYGIVNSTAFLLVNYWSELGNYIDKKRYIVLAIIGFVQISTLLIYKFYFFSKIYH